MGARVTGWYGLPNRELSFIFMLEPSCEACDGKGGVSSTNGLVVRIVGEVDDHVVIRQCRKRKLQWVQSDDTRVGRRHRLYRAHFLTGKSDHRVRDTFQSQGRASRDRKISALSCVQNHIADVGFRPGGESDVESSGFYADIKREQQGAGDKIQRRIVCPIDVG